MLGNRVPTLHAVTQDKVQVLVLACLDNGGDALFPDTRERALVATQEHCVHHDHHIAICAILEADREGYTRGKFAGELKFGGVHADSAPQNKVINVLWRNSAEKLQADWNAEVVEVIEKLAGKAKPFVGLKRTVYRGIVDEIFPANCCMGFLDEERQVRCVRKGFPI